MRRPVLKLVVVCLLLLAAVQPRSRGVPPPVITPSATPVVDWTPLRIKLDEQAYREAAAAATTTTAPRNALRVPRNHLPHRGFSSARECVAEVEHGGSYSESTNPTHKGRYQFSRPTWIAFGGPAEHWDDWSLTSPAEQDEVFERAWNSPGGPGNWFPYDGCG